jgi:hypothetical protein
MLLTACGSGSGNAKPSSTTIRSAGAAETSMTQACLRFAQTWLSTDPKSGVPQMTLQQGIAGITSAATMAGTAAGLDPRWVEGKNALEQLAQGMTQTDSAKVRSSLARVERVCTPLISKVGTATTAP